MKSLLFHLHNFSNVFFTFGDWGSGSKIQHDVANIMNKLSDELSPQFVMALGDNFYELGVFSVEDKQWKENYRDVYNASGMQVPFYAVLGNHDYYGFHPYSQIEYYKESIDNRWFMEDYYYSQRIEMGNGTILELVILDTVTLCSNMFVEDVKIDLNQSFADLHMEQKISYMKRGGKQLLWLQSTLASSTADWLIVTGHYPVFSGGGHGDSSELVKNIEPLLSKYKVDMYLCGHDHTLQHLKYNDVNYFVSGSAGKTGSFNTSPHALYGTGKSGFMIHSLSNGGQKMNVFFVDSKGNIIYETSLKQQPRFSSFVLEKSKFKGCINNWMNYYVIFLKKVF